MVCQFQKAQDHCCSSKNVDFTRFLRYRIEIGKTHMKHESDITFVFPHFGHFRKAFMVFEHIELIVLGLGIPKSPKTLL